MTAALLQLLDDARSLADPSAYLLRGRAWHMDGGRMCPFECSTCSQPVFIERVTGEWDYGARGGPGHTWCIENCRHGFRDQLAATDSTEGGAT